MTINAENSVPEERRVLAGTVDRLCRLLGSRDGKVLTGKSIVSRVDRVCYTGVIQSSLSRYRSGKTVPPEGFLRALHQAACEDAGRDAVRITLDDLLAMKRAAKDVRAQARDLRAEVGQLRVEMENLRTEAGLVTSSAATLGSAPLPVPLAEGDRQRSNYDDTVERFVSRAGELYVAGMHEEVLGVLRETPLLLNPAQMAACIALFRERNLTVLADTMVHGFGREQPDRAVMHLAARLLELDLTVYAGKLLNVALG